MYEVMQKFERSPMQLSAAAFVIGIVAAIVPHADAVAGDSASRRGNPCDTRDTCSADPAKYVSLRENGPVKAREHVGEMRWCGGGPPADMYVVSKTVGSRDFANAKPCDVRDACSNGQQTYKVVRVGPAGEEITTAAVKVADKPDQK